MLFKPFLRASVTAAIVLSSTIAHASIINGDFSTGDFTGWSLDTDGFAGAAPDFQIENLAGNDKARIEADFWSNPGDPMSTPLDAVFFANTLFQGLDLTIPANSDLVLSFDWEFGGEQSVFDENFIVGLGDGSGSLFGTDGTLGFLLNPAAFGIGSFSALLNPSFFNASGWTLELQMNAGVDAFGSFALIDNVALDVIPRQSVPVPSTLFLMWLVILVPYLRMKGNA